MDGLSTTVKNAIMVLVKSSTVFRNASVILGGTAIGVGGVDAIIAVASQ